MPDTLHSGFIAIAGRPNMGKSTFLNRVLGKKVSIVTPKPQTTRHRIMGVLHRPGFQMVFLDTPGIHQTRGTLLNKTMVGTAYQACRDVDLILFFTEASSGVTHGDWEILKRLGAEGIPIFLILNKSDLTTPARLLSVLAGVGEGCRERGVEFAEVFPLSSTRGDNVDHLLEVIAARLPEGDPYFPEGEVTDQAEEQMAAEIVREKLFMALDRELPYALAVRTETFEEQENGRLLIGAQILVARANHKAIVIGKGGARLKQVGIAARKELQKLLGCPVNLQLWVKVEESWPDDQRMLRSLGYEEGGGGDEDPG